jgi:hypothetical protein
MAQRKEETTYTPEGAHLRTLTELQGASLEEQERRRKLIAEDEKKLKREKKNV